MEDVVCRHAPTNKATVCATSRPNVTQTPQRCANAGVARLVSTENVQLGLANRIVQQIIVARVKIAAQGTVFAVPDRHAKIINV